MKCFGTPSSHPPVKVKVGAGLSLTGISLKSFIIPMHRLWGEWGLPVVSEKQVVRSKERILIESFVCSLCDASPESISELEISYCRGSALTSSPFRFCYIYIFIFK